MALVGVADGEARYSKLIWLGIGSVQEGERSVTALLSIHANYSETSAVAQVVVESDTLRKVGAGVESAGPLVVVDGSTGESVLKNPVGAGFWSIETLSGTVAGRVDAILVVEVDHRHDTGDIDSLEVSHTPSIISRGLKLREFALGDLSLADGPIVVFILAGKDVDIRVGRIIAVACAEGTSENGGGKSEDGENGDSGEMHVVWIIDYWLKESR